MERITWDFVVLLFFVLQTTRTFGSLVVLREAEVSTWFGWRKTKKMTLQCISEDDGAGLIWNDEISVRNSSYSSFTQDFKSTSANFSEILDCNFNSQVECTKMWFLKDWNLTNSVENPMGPVFDRRWEGLREYDTGQTKYQDNYSKQLSGRGSMVFSVRGSKEVQISFCSEENQSNFCYWIIINQFNEKSTIRNCVNNFKSPPTYSKQSQNCKMEKTIDWHSLLSLTEWRTFILTWDVGVGKISLYNTEKILTMYVDQEKRPENINKVHSLYIASEKHAVLRFHTYSFLHTTNQNASITSPKFISKNVCVEINVGLCAKCQLEIGIDINAKEYKILKTVQGFNSVHGLPMWQYVKINTTLNLRETVKLIMKPILLKKVENPIWAVADIRTCPPVGTVRYNSITIIKNVDDIQYRWPHTTCQKLFHNKTIVVDPMKDITRTLNSDKFFCPIEKKVGPSCSMNCSPHFDKEANCRGTIICTDVGCSCPAGFVGDTCQETCSSGRYGHNCELPCGMCKGNVCDSSTGFCIDGCSQSKEYYLPPYCKTAVPSPPKPGIIFLNETSIKFKIAVRKEYKIRNASYTCSIQQERSLQIIRVSNLLRIYKKTKFITANAVGLTPGTTYIVRCILYFDDDAVGIKGIPQIFTTHCTSTSNFEIIRGTTTLLVKRNWSKEYEKNPFSCPGDWYKITVYNTNMKVINEGNFNNKSYNVSSLTPYTVYKVTIYNENITLLSREVETLQTAPTRIRNLRTSLTSGNEMTLSWEIPEPPNGKIIKYEVGQKILAYKGCKDFGLKSPLDKGTMIITNSTSVVLRNLHWYTEYQVEVSAYTTEQGPSVKEIFSTQMSDIPTSVVSDLRFNGISLNWNRPKDCTTISGPVPVTKIIINGVSELVKKFHTNKQTTSQFLNLDDSFYGTEKYIARVYLTRRYDGKWNEKLYQKLTFTIPPKAPPKVRNLEIYEMDSSLRVLSLRWQSPMQPIHGTIEYYILEDCNKQCTHLKNVYPTEYCELWNDYICATITSFAGTIQVSAKNKNVTEAGPALSVEKASFKGVQEAPNELFAVSLEKGVMNLSWSHPWISVGRLQKFLINVTRISTDLRNPPVSNSMSYTYRINKYHPEYNKILYLLPSSTYNVSICAMTDTKKSDENHINLTTPLSIAFGGELSAKANDNNLMIELRIPPVLNDTKDSMTHVVVKGPRPNKTYHQLDAKLTKVAEFAYYEIAWLAASFPTEKFSGEMFFVGDNNVYRNATNYALKPETSYLIVVMVQTKATAEMDSQFVIKKTSLIRLGKVPESKNRTWIIIVIVFLLVAALGFYVYRRNRRVLVPQALSSGIISQHNNENMDVSVSWKTGLKINTVIEEETLSQTNMYDVSICTINTSDENEETSLVKVKDFEDYVKQAVSSGLLDQQYATFPRGQTKSWDYGVLPQNKPKNRYGNLIAYDETRVVLDKLPDDPYSDYINANYIKGYNKEKCYIATQGPKANTVVDFWRMIWQEKVLVICMLTNIIENGKVRCEQYWPNIGRKKKYGDLVVMNAKHNVFADYTLRILYVTHGEETRKIEHLHYTMWPDHGIPLYTHSVVTYLKKLLAIPSGNGPVVIHCSAGVGRTGTIILCDICLRRAAAEGVMNVFAETKMLRSQRPNMVDNKQQYLFTHLTIVECLLSFPTSLPCIEILPAKIKELKQQAPLLYQRLQDIVWQDEALQPATINTSLSTYNREKNRFPELILEKANRVYLKRYPVWDEDSDYIPAVYVDGVKQQKQYIATQLPMPLTFGDFWRMIAEFQVELIVMLQPSDPDDPTCCQLVPSLAKLKPTPYIDVTIKEVTESEHYTSKTLILTDDSEKIVRKQQVTILCVAGWKPGKNQDPPSVKTLVTVWQATEKISRREAPTVVLCHDGVTGCGLYLALSFLLERMAIDRECDICLAIRAIRRSRPEFIRSIEQLEYLLDAALIYLEYFETYANFT